MNRNGTLSLGAALGIASFLIISMLTVQKFAQYKNRHEIQEKDLTTAFYNTEVGAIHAYFSSSVDPSWSTLVATNNYLPSDTSFENVGNFKSVNVTKSFDPSASMFDGYWNDYLTTPNWRYKSQAISATQNLYCSDISFPDGIFAIRNVAQSQLCFSAPVPPPPEPNCQITANPSTGLAGFSTVLKMDVSGDITYAILDGTTIPISGGTKTVMPLLSTTYQGSVIGPLGIAVCTVSVNLEPTGTSPTCDLAANPTSVVSGDSAQLSLSVNGSPSSAILDGNSAPLTGGSETVTPPTVTIGTDVVSLSNTYRGSVTASDGTVDACVVALPVEPPAAPQGCEITASPSPVVPGETTVLNLLVFGPTTSATLDGTSVGATGGLKTETPTVTTTYQASVTGPNGTSSCGITVHVVPACQITANPSSVALGGTTTLNMTTTGNVTSATLAGTSVATSGGSTTVTVGADSIFQGTVSGPDGTNTCSIEIAATPTCHITAAPSSVPGGGATTLTMTTAGDVTSAILDGTTVAASGGTKSETVNATTTYQGSVTGPGGTSTCGVTVSVVPPPTCTITAAPNPVVESKPTLLTMTTSDITRPGSVTTATLAGTNVSTTGGTLTVTPTTLGKFTYKGTVTGPAGTGTCSVIVRVVLPPSAVSVFKTISNTMDGDQSICLSITGSTATLTAREDDSDFFQPMYGTQQVTLASGKSFFPSLPGPAGWGGSVTIALPGDWSHVVKARPVLTYWGRAWGNGQMSAMSADPYGTTSCFHIHDGCCGYNGGVIFSLDWQLILK